MTRGFLSDDDDLFGRPSRGPADRSTLVDLAGIVLQQTERALRIDFGDGRPVWLPKSTVQDNGDGTFTLPEWQAREKGLI